MKLFKLNSNKCYNNKMKNIQIIEVPNNILTTKCKTVKKIDEHVIKIVSDLEYALNNSLVPGTGIASNQIGSNLCVCIVRDFLSYHKDEKDQNNNVKNQKSITVTDNINYSKTYNNKLNVEQNDYTDYILINPKFKPISNKQIIDWEGCLSIPDTFGLVSRFKKIRVQALNIGGEKMSFVANDYLARVIQHEIDHLNGILFTSKIISKTKSKKELEDVYKLYD